MAKFFAVLVLSLGSITAANADSGCPLLLQFFHLCGGTPPPVKPVRAPEIDPAGAVNGLMLLAGGLMVLRGRRTRR